MHSITINVKDSVLDNILYLLNNLPEVEIVEKKSKKMTNKTDKRWTYWREDELDNFGKVAIGLSKNNYDEEDYSTW